MWFIHMVKLLFTLYGREDIKFTCMSVRCCQIYEKAEEAICEQTMADLLYLTENEGKLRLDTYCM